MHIAPNLIQWLVSPSSSQRRIKSRRNVSTLLGKLRDALRCIEDQWTLECVDGEVFEEVEIVEEVADGHVTFLHKEGRSRIPLSRLSQKSLTHLFAGFPDAKPSDATSGVEHGLPALPSHS